MLWLLPEGLQCLHFATVSNGVCVIPTTCGDSVTHEGDESKEAPLEITASDARDRLGELIDRALAGERVVISRNGRRIAVLVSLRDAERLVA